MSEEKKTCRTHCIYWNSIDKDCEIYGEQHVPPRKCAIYKNGLIIEDNKPHLESTVLFADEVEDEPQS